MNNRFSIIVCTASLAYVLLFGIWSDAAAATKQLSGTTSNLGESLLDGLLDGELGETLKAAPAQEENKLRDTKQRDKKPSNLLPDQELLRRMLEKQAGVPQGEDIGQEGHPLAPVVEGMRRAEQQIQNAGDKQTAVPVQREVVARLEQLITQMEKQCQCNNSSDSQQKKKKQSSKRTQAKSGSKPAPGKPEPSQSNTAARTSTTRMGTAGDPPPQPLSQEELMKAAWGHLPEKVRERMLQGAGEEFLPEYREEIEAYFRRLAEREAQGE